MLQGEFPGLWLLGLYRLSIAAKDWNVKVVHDEMVIAIIRLLPLQPLTAILITGIFEAWLEDAKARRVELQ